MKPLDFSNQSVRNLLESITDGFYFLDSSWIVLYFNKQAERILDISRDEIVGKNLWTCFPEEYGKEFYKNFKQSFESQQSMYFEAYLHRLGLWGELTVYPSPTGISVHFRDITERKKKESLLQEMNNNYRMILKATSGAIWEYILGQDTCYWHNEHFKELFGYDIVNAPVFHTFWESLIHPDDREARLHRAAAQVQTGLEMDRTEYRFKKADGTYAYVLERTFLERNESGEPVKLVGCTEDITVVKRAEQELQKSEVNHRLLFQKSSLAQIICAEDTLQILKVNEAALEMYGYTNREFLSLDIHNLRPPQDRASLKERVRQAKLSKRMLTYMVTHEKKNGEQLIVEVNAARMEFDGIPCFLIALSDHTQRNHLERQLEDLRLVSQRNVTKAVIEAQEKQKEEIAKELHDNVNQVLATAKLLLTLIQPADDLQAGHVDKCREAITYSIEEIRRLSRSFTPPSLGEISLEQAVQNLVASIPFAAGAEVNTEISHLDESRLEEGLKVFVRISQSDRLLNVMIADNGKGFDVNSKRTGIGLRNIRTRAELYNGELYIHSEPGSGCQVIVSFAVSTDEK